MVRTGRKPKPVPLRKPKNSKPKELKKPRDEIKKEIECKRKAMGKIRKKIRDQGGDRRLEAKLEERSREIEEFKRLLEPPLETTPEARINLIENQTHDRIYQVTGFLNHDISNLILDNICPIIQMQKGSFSAYFAQSIADGINSHSTTRCCPAMVPSRA